MNLRRIPAFPLIFLLACGGGGTDTTQLTSQVTELASRLEANETQLVAALARIEDLEADLEIAQELIDEIEQHTVRDLPQAMTVTIEE